MSLERRTLMIIDHAVPITRGSIMNSTHFEWITHCLWRRQSWAQRGPYTIAKCIGANTQYLSVCCQFQLLILALSIQGSPTNSCRSDNQAKWNAQRLHALVYISLLEKKPIYSAASIFLKCSISMLYHHISLALHGPFSEEKWANIPYMYMPPSDCTPGVRYWTWTLDQLLWIIQLHL